MTRWPMWLRLAVTLVTVACGDLAGVDGSVANLLGNWSYASSQDAPAPASQEGTLSITAQNGRNFSGTAQIVETDQNGNRRTLTGYVQGRSLDSTKVDFDLTILGVARRHLGVIEEGPITGAWIGRGENGGTYSGEFRAEREQ
jgi:hypothetical protein